MCKLLGVHIARIGEQSWAEKGVHTPRSYDALEEFGLTRLSSNAPTRSVLLKLARLCALHVFDAALCRLACSAAPLTHALHSFSAVLVCTRMLAALFARYLQQ